MKDFLSKEHYCYRIHTLSMKNSAHPPPSIDNPRYGLPPPPFLEENLDPPFYDFSKPPYK